MVCRFQVNKLENMLSYQECYEKVVLVYMGLWKHKQATPSNCGKILLNIQYRPGTERSVQWHHRETCGYGKNLKCRDNPQPSANGIHYSELPMHAVQRLNVGGPMIIHRHKIKSGPLETGLTRGIDTLPYSAPRRVCRVFI